MLIIKYVMQLGRDAWVKAWLFLIGVPYILLLGENI